MKREDFYTGEPENTGSPFSQEFITEQEAINNAGFGQYFYDPGYRSQIQQTVYPGGYGYNPYMQPYQGYYGFQPAYGLGSNPFYSFQPNFVQPQPRQEIQYYVKPVNFGGSEFLPNVGFDEQIERLKLEYWQKEQEQEAERSVINPQANQFNPYYNYTNYYGIPYYNPYQYNSLYSEINEKINEMKEQARQNRIDLNFHLSKLCHNYLGDEYNEESLKERFTGKVVTIPGMETYHDYYNQARFQNLVPFDNTDFYREYDKKISDEFHEIIPENAGLEETFLNMGVVYAKYQMEEERHRRRDGSNLYDASNDSYKYFVRAKAAERYAKKHGLSLTQTVRETDNNINQMKQSVLNQYPTLSESAKLSDDGTLNITCNFGSRAGQVYSVHNSQEAGYEQDRQRFLDSIYQTMYDSPNASN